jgi:pyruvate/2-oxoglutarate dehydrogenase complex dihydrolipoamide dehydrogenase (E3) component
MTDTYDALIIGAGQAGPPLAERLTAAGMSVGLIERKLFGGTCVNTGCIPTKTLVASAYAAQLARRAMEYGVRSSMTNCIPARRASGRLATNGRGAFTHTSYNDFEIVAANLLSGERRRVSDRIPAYALYIDPPLGRAGMTEAQARATGRPLVVGRRPMTRVGRAIEKGETQGFMMAIADAETHHILGAAILGTGGDEAIHGILDAMNARIPYTVLQRAVPIHPTVSELIPTLLGEMKPISPQSP